MKTFAFLLMTMFLLLGCKLGRQGGGRFAEQPTSPSGQAVLPGHVRISYEVRQPGDYPYKRGMSVEELVEAAGGMTDFASGVQVVRGGTNLVKAYYGSLQLTAMSKYMRTALEPDDQVWISRREF